MAQSQEERGGAMGALSLTVRTERWPIKGTFTISRGSKREAHVVVAVVSDGSVCGRGECVPYPRYGESVEGVAATIEACRDALRTGLDRKRLATALPAGAARNALDCALWDLESKRTGISAASRAGLDQLGPVPTCFTISLADPETMACQAKSAAAHPLLKLKLGGTVDTARLRAVRAAVPDARLVADANEAWDPLETESLLVAAADARVELIEQPLPAGKDAVLANIARPVPVCADESVHDSFSVEALTDRYDAVNIKLDKTGGLTEALKTIERARALGLKTMAGSMVATSLSMAPALILAQTADWADLDGPLLLSRDRSPGLTYDSGLVFPPPAALWG